MTDSTPSPRDMRIAQVPPGARVGSGLLQWNRAGWFGSQLGGTLWLGLCGGIVAIHDLSVGLGIVGLCLAANGAGFLMWRMRSRLAPYLGIQLLCLVSFVAAAISFALLYHIGIASEIAEQGADGLPFPLWVYLGIYPLLMGLFAFLDRRGH